MFFSATHLFDLISQYRYVALFPLSIIEGPIVSVIAGFLISIGQLSFALALGILVSGEIIGDHFYYSLGRWSRGTRVEHLAQRLGLQTEGYGRLEEHFRLHTGKTLTAGKILSFPSVVLLVAAGVARVPYPKFLGFTVLLSIPRSFVLILLGFYFGRAYSRFDHYSTFFSIGVLMLIVGVLLVFWLVRVRRRARGSLQH